jgi:high-affinity Fe2+/Pb2+ permease
MSSSSRSSRSAWAVGLAVAGGIALVGLILALLGSLHAAIVCGVLTVAALLVAVVLFLLERASHRS